MMNDNLGYINFHTDLAVTTITIAKRELYLLQNVL